jgi:hypothetical protein
MPLLWTQMLLLWGLLLILPLPLLLLLAVIQHGWLLVIAVVDVVLLSVRLVEVRVVMVVVARLWEGAVVLRRRTDTTIPHAANNTATTSTIPTATKRGSPVACLKIRPRPRPAPAPTTPNIRTAGTTATATPTAATTTATTVARLLLLIWLLLLV